MKYEELKEYLKKNPYCFRTVEERENEFDHRVNEYEGKRVQCTRCKTRYNTEAV